MKINVCDTDIDLVDNVIYPEIIRNTFETAYLSGKCDDPFYVCDLGDIVRKHTLWTLKMPRVEPFYAIKCNPHSLIVQLLANLGIGFDCASKGEISQVLSYGVLPNKIIYANPCKQISHIKYAETSGVQMMTFDSSAELKKISVYHPHSQLILRIFTGTNKARCPLGLKFGASMESIRDLLLMATELKLNVVGVSFHVGSGCFDASAYHSAMVQANYAFKVAESLGTPMYLLDLGGGFPGNLDTDESVNLFEDVCSTINSSIETMFPPGSGVRIIAEPGRFYVSSAFQLACTVTSVRHSVKPNSISGASHFSYFLNDGVYGSFNCTIFDHYIGDHYLLPSSCDDSELHESIFWGPTCDSMDKILDPVLIRQLDVGERVIFKNMGAYTMAAGSRFNGFEYPYIRWVALKTEWMQLAPLLGYQIPVVECDSFEMDLLNQFTEIPIPTQGEELL